LLAVTLRPTPHEAGHENPSPQSDFSIPLQSQKQVCSYDRFSLDWTRPSRLGSWMGLTASRRSLLFLQQQRSCFKHADNTNEDVPRTHTYIREAVRERRVAKQVVPVHAVAVCLHFDLRPQKFLEMRGKYENTPHTSLCLLDRRCRKAYGFRLPLPPICLIGLAYHAEAGLYPTLLQADF